MPPALHPTRGFDAAFVAGCLDEALSLPGPTAVLGLGGLPGSGKSTLAAQLQALARVRGLACEILSLDDVYLGRRARLALARDVHPLLATRGPPGTHEPALALRVLDQLRAGHRPALPRFDKGRDTRRPPSRWPRPAASPRLVVFEGWCLGTPPQPPAALATPINALERERDPDGHWRRFVNDALAGYAPLWARLDRLVWLHAPSWDIVPAWRWQQEQGARPGPRRMDRAAVEGFLQHFERVGRQALATLPAIADRVVRLDEARRPLS